MHYVLVVMKILSMDLSTPMVQVLTQEVELVDKAMCEAARKRVIKDMGNDKYFISAECVIRQDV